MRSFNLVKGGERYRRVNSKLSTGGNGAEVSLLALLAYALIESEVLSTCRWEELKPACGRGWQREEIVAISRGYNETYVFHLRLYPDPTALRFEMIHRLMGIEDTAVLPL